MIKLDNRKIKDYKVLLEPSICTCSKKHIPNPMMLIEIYYGDQSSVVCPAFFVNLMSLLQSYDLHEGPPPGSITKHYGKEVRDLASVVWRS